MFLPGAASWITPCVLRFLQQHIRQQMTTMSPRTPPTVSSGLSLCKDAEGGSNFSLDMLMNRTFVDLTCCIVCQTSYQDHSKTYQGEMSGRKLTGEKQNQSSINVWKNGVYYYDHCNNRLNQT